MDKAAIVLAAGAGTRMKSKKPKVVHEILGKPLVRWVIDAAKYADIKNIVTVVGFGADQVEPLVSDTTVAVQHERRGTADAVASAREALAGFEGSVVVLSGDCPLISADTIAALVDEREQAQAAMVVLTMEPENPFGYGRIVRDVDTGEVLRIVEQKDASPEEAAITECNSGFYCFDAAALFDALDKVTDDNAQGEYYLTDVLAICRAEGKRVVALKAPSATECLGINSRKQLAEASLLAQTYINEIHMDAGVTMWDPTTVWIGPDVVIDPDVEIMPMTMLFDETTIGSDSLIGPNTRLRNTQVGCGCRVDETVAIDARIDDGATCGPRAYLRPGAHLCENAKAGTHVEIKKSTVGRGSKVPHLSYVGDATIGEGVNLGAGTITCNYDGKKKHPTVIEDGVFIGSDTMLVAPVTVGAGAIVGAGSTITKDVPAGALALERNEQIAIEGWADRKRAQQEQEE